jgi:nicotinate phosphoribosyltransferase
MGSRRTHEEAAIACARAAYLAGFASTSNLAAGRRWGVPTAGTAAHAFTLLHDDERAAFAAQVDALGQPTTLLVDTYDVAAGIRAAVEVAGPDLGAIRLDSGDLYDEAVRARELLDSLGATGTRIVATSDLDERALVRLAEAPIDGYGVGTALVTGGGHPTAGFVYKLVAREDGSGRLVPVEKRSAGKHSSGGRKAACRLVTDGVAREELVYVGEAPGANAGERLLSVACVRDGELLDVAPLEVAREHHRRVLAELPPDALSLDPGEPAIPVTRVGAA